jgi:DNA-binding transcriptional LysR family regulator
MNRPAVRELECFVAVTDCLNFSRAARQLNLSQPPLTRHIQSLEAKLGVKLFQRNTHAVSLTEAGALYREDAQAILSHLDRASATLRRASQGETVRLRLAFIGALLDEKLVRLLQRFRQLHPACQVQITDLSPSAQITAIKAGELDGGFIGARPAQPLKGVAFAVWGTEPLLLALPETHELAKVRALTWPDLKNRHWVMVSRVAAPAFRQQFAQLEKARGLSARIIQESDRVPAILTMVAAGSGVTMVPQSVTHLISKGVVFRNLPSPQPMLHHAFAHPSGEMSTALEAFIKLLRNI